jgi:hypothetical protein
MKRRFIETILEEGCQRGEFFLTDLEKASLSFKQATVMFHTPLYMEMYSLDDLQCSCKNIVNLLLIAITDHKQDLYAKN